MTNPKKENNEKTDSIQDKFASAAKSYEKDRKTVLQGTVEFIKENPLVVPMAACCLAVFGGALGYTQAIWEFNDALQAGKVPAHLLTEATLKGKLGGREYGLDIIATLRNFEDAPGYAKQAAASAMTTALATLPLAGYGKASEIFHKWKLDKKRDAYLQAQKAICFLKKEDSTKSSGNKPK